MSPCSYLLHGHDTCDSNYSNYILISPNILLLCHSYLVGPKFSPVHLYPLVVVIHLRSFHCIISHEWPYHGPYMSLYVGENPSLTHLFKFNGGDLPGALSVIISHLPRLHVLCCGISPVPHGCLGENQRSIIPALRLVSYLDWYNMHRFDWCNYYVVDWYFFSSVMTGIILVTLLLAPCCCCYNWCSCCSSRLGV